VLQKYTFAGEGVFFLIFFSFDRGSSIMIDILLFKYAFSKKFSVARLYLLLIYAAVEIAGILGCIVYYGLNSSNFWSEGYVFIIFNAVMTVAYLRRYFFLREVKMQAIEETEAEK
jgi:hypothetical protein